MRNFMNFSLHNPRVSEQPNRAKLKNQNHRIPTVLIEIQLKPYRWNNGSAPTVPFHEISTS